MDKCKEITHDCNNDASWSFTSHQISDSEHFLLLVSVAAVHIGTSFRQKVQPVAFYAPFSSCHNHQAAEPTSRFHKPVLYTPRRQRFAVGLHSAKLTLWQPFCNSLFRVGYLLSAKLFRNINTERTSDKIARCRNAKLNDATQPRYFPINTSHLVGNCVLFLRWSGNKNCWRLKHR
jgi:hypothetical protein